MRHRHAWLVKQMAPTSTRKGSRMGSPLTTTTYSLSRARGRLRDKPRLTRLWRLPNPHQVNMISWGIRDQISSTHRRRVPSKTYCVSQHNRKHHRTRRTCSTEICVRCDTRKASNRLPKSTRVRMSLATSEADVKAKSIIAQD